VNSKRDEYVNGSFWRTYLPTNELRATSASYFDERCGLISYTDNWMSKWVEFTNNLINYKPRDFILSELSPDACRIKWINKLKG
jgi:hypothetical protein